MRVRVWVRVTVTVRVRVRVRVRPPRGCAPDRDGLTLHGVAVADADAARYAPLCEQVAAPHA